MSTKGRTFFCMVKGPAADATDAPQKEGLTFNALRTCTFKFRYTHECNIL